MGNIISDSILNWTVLPCDYLVHIFNFEDNLDELKNALEDLKAIRNDTLREIDAEERKGRRRLAEVNRWLSKVQTIETNSNLLMAEAYALLERMSTYGYCSNNIISTFSCTTKIPKMLSEVKGLRYRGCYGGVAEGEPFDCLAPNHDTVEYIEKLESNLEDLQKQMQDLNAMRNDLLKRVLKEEGRGLQGLPKVKGWFSMVEMIEPEASRLLDKSISELHKLSKYYGLSYISESTNRYSRNVSMMLQEVKTLKLGGVFEVVVDDRAHMPLVKEMPPIQPTVSQKKLLEWAWNSLMDEDVGTLGLYGMGGAGKTTLLTQIKDKGAGSKFVLVLFVVVVPEEVESIQDEIARSIGIFGNSNWRKRTQTEKASEIYNVVNGKRYLLLLDDIQKEVDLEEIGVPMPSRENGCKIIFTTSSWEVRGSKWVEVKCLSQEESWDLFQRTVGETTLKSHPDISELAQIVARKCCGLPIALSLIGKTMSRKSTVREWHHAIHALVSSAAEFSDMEDDTIFPILKFIYDNLPDEKIKLCFLYCAMFPKNSNIRKGNLVDYWIGEGIIEEEDRERAEIQGYELIDDMVRMQLLMEDESGYSVKMHGIVREVALWIASDFGRQKDNFVVVGPERRHKMPQVNWRRVRRISVTSTLIESISDSPHCSELTALFLQDNNLKWISGGFFRWMTSLVVLNLSSNTELSELQEEVSFLVSLQFLNLSRTCIRKLPLGLKELKRLMHLDLEHTLELKDIKVIPSLLNLQVLRLFKSVPIEFSIMEGIQRLESLKEWTLTVTQHAVLERLLGNHRLASCIRRLSIRQIIISDGGISLLNVMRSLCQLDMEGCDIPKLTIDWRSNMIRREIVHFGNIEEIPQFRHLGRVSLQACDSLRDLTWLLFAPCLRDLSLNECFDIKEIISKEKAMDQPVEQPFQNLTRLSLDGLPKLESIYWTSLPFPVLQYLLINGCPNLTRLPFNLESAKGNPLQVEFDFFVLKIVTWEDEATKQRFCNSI